MTHSAAYCPVFTEYLFIVIIFPSPVKRKEENDNKSHGITHDILTPTKRWNAQHLIEY